MNQNTSANNPGEQAQGVAGNPYYANQQGAVPDLDANAPYLKSDDVRRLNRKALIFLGGIVVLLALAAAWLFGGALGRKDAPAKPEASEKVVIPSAPKEDNVAPPLPYESADASMQEVPPLPMANDYASQAPALPPMPADLAQQAREPTLAERRMLNGDLSSGPQGGESSDDDAGFGQQGLPPGLGKPAPEGPPEGLTSAQPLYNPDTLLLRGTYIRCVLETRVITDVPGYTSCVVTEPVYSVNGRRLLLPKGSKISGSYDSDAIRGERAVVVWDRVTTPTGLDVNMRSPGIDNLGSAGHPGHYSAHWGERIASALLISMLSDAFKYAGAKHGPMQAEIANGAVVLSPYESNTASTIDRMAELAMEKSMSRPPTVTINQGTVVNVYVSRDVDFSTVMR